MRLAFVPNIEMRMFNPLAGARGSTLGRLFSSLDDASRIQQRMHNKLFIADNVLGVTGGRNLGDAYFGNGKSGNFVDLDVLAADPIVQDLSRSFDAYWNNERAYPVQSLVTREELDRSAASPPPPSVAGRARRRPMANACAAGTSSRWTCGPPFVWARRGAGRQACQDPGRHAEAAPRPRRRASS